MIFETKSGWFLPAHLVASIIEALICVRRHGSGSVAATALVHVFGVLVGVAAISFGYGFFLLVGMDEYDTM